jgi:hypothetical protein
MSRGSARLVAVDGVFRAARRATGHAFRGQNVRMVARLHGYAWDGAYGHIEVQFVQRMRSAGPGARPLRAKRGLGPALQLESKLTAALPAAGGAVVAFLIHAGACARVLAKATVPPSHAATVALLLLRAAASNCGRPTSSRGGHDEQSRQCYCAHRPPECWALPVRLLPVSNSWRGSRSGIHSDEGDPCLALCDRNIGRCSHLLAWRPRPSGRTTTSCAPRPGHQEFTVLQYSWNEMGERLCGTPAKHQINGLVG